MPRRIEPLLRGGYLRIVFISALIKLGAAVQKLRLCIIDLLLRIRKLCALLLLTVREFSLGITDLLLRLAYDLIITSLFPDIRNLFKPFDSLVHFVLIGLLKRRKPCVE